jgi:hypothetical protein
VLVSRFMMVEEENNSWSELLTSMLSCERKVSSGKILWENSPTVFAECEQSGTSRFAVTCQDRPSDKLLRRHSATANKSAGRSMARSFSNRFRSRLTMIRSSFAKLLVLLKPAVKELRTQRMCPSCGLITPRARPFCLECGKLLNVVHLEHKDAR